MEMGRGTRDSSTFVVEVIEVINDSEPAKKRPN